MCTGLVDTLLDGDMSTLAVFVCRYTIHASTVKDDLKKPLRLEQQKYLTPVMHMKANMWACSADFPTNSDLAFAAWQYIKRCQRLKR